MASDQWHRVAAGDPIIRVATASSADDPALRRLTMVAASDCVDARTDCCYSAVDDIGSLAVGAPIHLSRVACTLTSRHVPRGEVNVEAPPSRATRQSGTEDIALQACYEGADPSRRPRSAHGRTGRIQAALSCLREANEASASCRQNPVPSVRRNVHKSIHPPRTHSARPCSRPRREACMYRAPHRDAGLPWAKLPGAAVSVELLSLLRRGSA